MFKKNNCQGFTLIELAVVMIVTGILLAAFTYPYSIYQKNKRIQATNENVQTVTAAIGSFRGLHGRYPCPASFEASRGDFEYGRETACADETLIATPGTCVNGICLQESNRTVTIPGSPSVVTITPRVRIGAVPFRQLGIDEGDIYDGYGNRIIYAVTERLGSTAGFDPNDGGIGILNEEGTSAIEPADSAHFVLLSSGPNEVGAYTRDGAHLPCTATGADSENCDFESQANAVFRASRLMNTGDNTHFDDTVSFFTKNEVPLWRISEDTSGNDIVQIPEGAVGFFGESGANPVAPLADGSEIPDGVVRAAGGATDGRLLANQLCDDGGTACFSSTVIAGQLADGEGLECPAGQYMAQIANGTRRCADEVIVRCDPGQFMQGFNSNGTIKCAAYMAPPANCAAQNVTLCSTTVTIPAGNHGNLRTVTAGANFSRTYRCNNGVWNQISQSGSCTCTPSTQSRNIACATGFTGTIYQERVLTCPAGTWSGWVNVGPVSCVCDPVVQTRNRLCPTGYTGAIQDSRQHVCPADTWTAWTEISNTCTCTPKTETRTLSCQTGYSGSIQQERNLQCPAGTWTVWTQTSNTCTCTATTETRNASCGTGYTGTIPQSRTFDCTAGTWSSWGATGPDSCVAIPPPVCSWRSQGSGGSADNYGIGARVGTTCTCGSASGPCNDKLGEGSFLNYSGCVCE